MTSAELDTVLCEAGITEIPSTRRQLSLLPHTQRLVQFKIEKIPKLQSKIMDRKDIFVQ